MGGNYEHWAGVLGICFSIMIVALSWCSVYWIRPIAHRLVCFVIATGLYSFILYANLSGSAVALMDNDNYALLLSEALEYHSLFGNDMTTHVSHYISFCGLVLVAYVVYWVAYAFIKKFKYSKTA